MANDEESGRKPLDPKTRRRLQQCFEQGTKVAAAGQFDYATDMYTMCVVGDPGNPIYVKSFLTNLQKKYDNNKKGASFSGMKTAGGKAAVKKAAVSKDWNTVITSGLEVLKINPWEAGTLLDIGRACEQLTFDECQIEYMKMALDGDLAEPEVNRAAAKAFARVGLFDEAIACWSRVKKAKPTDEEAGRAIADLAVEKTIKKGGYEDAQSTKEARVHKISDADDGDRRLSPEQQLERAIKKDPTDIDKYIELSDLHQRDEKFAEAEEVLSRAVDASGKDVKVVERLEDVQLRRARQQLEIAKKKAQTEKTEAAVKLYNSLKSDLVSKEILVYGNRCDRYPANLGFKCELAIRLEKGGKYAEAIKSYQAARSDLKRRGQVFMGLGRCFTQIKQYKMALDNFGAAVEAIPEREADQHKDALYHAGRLALHVKDLDAAERFLGALANMDFSYKDVAALLEKLAELRGDGEVEASDD